MATITAFIRTSKKSKEVNVRFRLRDGRNVDLYHAAYSYQTSPLVPTQLDPF